MSPLSESFEKRPKETESFPEVESAGDEDRIQSISLHSLKPVSIKPGFGLKVTNDWFDGVASFQPFANQLGFAWFAVGNENLGEVRATMFAVALIACDLLGHSSDESFGLLQGVAKDAPIVG